MKVRSRIKNSTVTEVRGIVIPIAMEKNARRLNLLVDVKPSVY